MSNNEEVVREIPANSWKYYIVIINERLDSTRNSIISFKQIAGQSEIFAKDRLSGQDYLPSQKLYTEHAAISSIQNKEYKISLPNEKYFTYICGVYNSDNSTATISIRLTYYLITTSIAFPLYMKIIIIAAAFVLVSAIIFIVIKLVIYCTGEVISLTRKRQKPKWLNS